MTERVAKPIHELTDAELALVLMRDVGFAIAHFHQHGRSLSEVISWSEAPQEAARRLQERGGQS